MGGGQRLPTFLRSLLLQGLWSFERMQGLGFLFAADPRLRSFYPEPERRKEALRRHLEYFNTQPHMAGFVLGAVLGMEREAASLEGPRREESVRRLLSAKRAMASALAAIGDGVFWGTLRPVCLAVAMAAWGLFWTLELPHPLLGGCLLYLALFNLPALWVRWEGLRLGESWGERMPQELARIRWRQALRLLRWTGLAAAAATAACVLLVPPFGPPGPRNAAWLAGCLLLHRHGLTGAKIYAIMGAVGVAWAWGWA
ncbi:MAG: PTS system mannose/fructose/sorbose family transporter subunit IID [Elusimicrobiota bacterium]